MKVLSRASWYQYLFILIGFTLISSCDDWDDDYEEPDNPDVPSLIANYNGTLIQSSHSGSAYHGAGQRYNHFNISYLGDDVYEVHDVRGYRIRFRFYLDQSGNYYYIENVNFLSGVGTPRIPPGGQVPIEISFDANGDVSSLYIYYNDHNNDQIALLGIRDNRVAVPAATHQLVQGQYSRAKPGCAGRTLHNFYFFADGTGYFKDPNRCVAPDCYYNDYFYWSIISPGTLMIEQTAYTECGVVKSFNPIQEVIYVSEDAQGRLVMNRSGETQYWTPF